MESIQSAAVRSVVTVGMVTDHDLVTTSGVAIIKEDATPSFWIGALLKGRLNYDVIFVAICTAEKEHVVHNASSINSKTVLVVMLKRILCYTCSQEYIRRRREYLTAL